MLTFIMKSFSGAKIQDLEYYVTPHLEHDKPDIAVIHTGSNKVSYNNLDIDASILAENIIKIWKECIDYGVEEVVISSVFVKKSSRLSSFIRKVNDELHALCSIKKFHFILHDNITRKYLCGDGVHLTEAGVNILADNIVNYLNEVFLGVNTNKLD